METYFSGILSPDQILTDETEIKQYGTDRTGHYQPNPSIVLFPKSTEDVSKILTYCNQNQIAVVPSGGRTGLSGAAVALNKEVVISLEKMNRILAVDPIGATISCEPGVILENLQHTVSDAGMYFPIDFAAKGSCQIGGIISTNAGGVNVLKYGMTRQSVLGLEIVLANGEILNLDRTLIKDNSGYDLKQLFIGAEGTLGIITKATFKCMPQIQNKQVMLLITNTFSAVPQILSKANSLDLQAFEYLNILSVTATIKAMPQLRYPFAEPNHTLLIEIDEESRETLDLFLEDLAEKNLILDATIAENSTEQSNFWTLREAVSDSLYLLGKIHANDISVPVASLTTFLDELETLFLNKYSGYPLGIFGHIGDGNLHIYTVDTLHTEEIAHRAAMKPLDKSMFALVQKYNGSISAEHGIGILKKNDLLYRRSKEELQLMKQIKSVFDPNQILNPGKIF